VAAVTLAGALGAQTVLAASTDNDITPANTLITANLKAGTKFKASASVSGVPVTLSCTGATFTFTTPSTGLGPVPISNPVFTGCKDNFGGTDTITANSTNGSWTVTLTPPKPSTNAFWASLGVKTPAALTIGIPENGGTFSSTLVKNCTGVIAPNGPTAITGKYDNKSTATYSAAKVPIGANGCTTPATASLAATWVMSPGFSSAP
jgi:hypothetical protein